MITCPANKLIGRIHNRMPIIIAPEDRQRWIASETDPSDLMKPFPAELMKMWPISTRVNTPANDDPEILTAVEEEALGQSELPL